MKCHVDAIQWGGGSSRIFRDLQKPMRFSGGGGSSTNFLFRDLQTSFSVNGALFTFPKGGPGPLAPPGIGHCGRIDTIITFFATKSTQAHLAI